jgi:3-oxoadipate enol-lactonase
VTLRVRSVPSSSPGVLLAVEEAGPPGAPAVVLLHGFPLSRSMWEPQLAALSGARRLIAPDARGVGASDVGDGQATMELLVDDLFALLDASQPGPVVGCGLSMGGYVLLRALEREPERFRAAVLCDTRSEADSDEGRLSRAATIRRIREDGVGPFADGFLGQVLAPGTAARDPELVARLRRLILANPPSGLRALLLAMATRTDTTPSLSRIAVPVLVLVGSEDALTPPAGARAMAARIPGARFEEIPGAGHLSNVEAPAAFGRALEAFLASLDAS